MGCCRALRPTGILQHQSQVLSYLALGSPTSVRPPVPACAGAPFTQPVLPLCKVLSSAANPFPHCPSGLRLHRPDLPPPPNSSAPIGLRPAAGLTWSSEQGWLCALLCSAGSQVALWIRELPALAIVNGLFQQWAQTLTCLSAGAICLPRTS